MCAAGGLQIAVGIDTDDNGQLDPSEVQQTANVCRAIESPLCEDITFTRSVEVPVFPNGNGTVVFDLDGDGHPDVLQRYLPPFALQTESLTVRLGSAPLRFSPAREYTLTNNRGSYAQVPDSVAGGDVDGDGTIDVVAAMIEPRQVEVLRNQGGGVLGVPEIYPLANQANSVALGDFDADGDLDIAVTESPSADVEILLNGGDGTFGDPVTTLSTASWWPRGFGSPSDVTNADFNGDGLADLALAVSLETTAGAAIVFLATGGGSFADGVAFEAAPRAKLIRTADFNRDGRIDLVTANDDYYQGAVSILLGRGDGTFGLPMNEGAPFGPSALDVADFNSDGWPDFFVTGEGGSIAFINHRDGTFTPVASSAMAFAAGDFDWDGRPDLITAGAETWPIFINSTCGEGGPPQCSESCPAGAVCVDSSCECQGATVMCAGQCIDPVTDSAFCGATNGCGVDGGTAGTACASDSYCYVGSCRCSASFGVDCGNGCFDSHTDLQHCGATPGCGISGGSAGQVCDGAQRCFVALNNYDAACECAWLSASVDYGTIVASRLQTARVIPADLNGDGKPDLLAAVDSDVVAFLNKGDGTFLDGVRYPVNRGDAGAVVADFDGDGVLDVAVSQGLLIGRGDGTFGAPQAAPFPSPVIAADMNGDGRPDVVSLQQRNRVRITTNVGGGAFGAETSVGPASAYFVAVGDMNDDGRNDLVIAEPRAVDVLLATATGSFETRVYPHAAFSSENLLLRDVDANGTLDVLFSSSSVMPPSVFILVNSGDGTLTSGSSIADSGYPLTAIGDLNGDGLPDALLAQRGSSHDRMAVLWNGPPGSFHLGVWTYNDAYRNMVVTDLNGDGADDLASVTYNYSTTSLIEVSVALNQKCQ